MNEAQPAAAPAATSEKDCPECNGRGRIVGKGVADLTNDWCSKCDGTGHVSAAPAAAKDERPVTPAAIAELREAWEAGFALCRTYSDNWAHWQGEQKENTWRRFLVSRAAPAPDAAPLLAEVEPGEPSQAAGGYRFDGTRRCDCGGVMFKWNASMVYRDAEDKVQWRCTSCKAIADLGSPAPRPTPAASATPAADNHLKWLTDCGWSGWLRDVFSGRITTSHGDTFASAKELRTWLELLPKWPDVRNVPPRSVTATPAGEADVEAIRGRMKDYPYRLNLYEPHNSGEFVFSRREVDATNKALHEDIPALLDLASRLAGDVARLTKERDALAEVFKGLPRTGDGVPIVPGRDYWRVMRPGKVDRYQSFAADAVGSERIYFDHDKAVAAASVPPLAPREASEPGRGAGDGE